MTRYRLAPHPDHPPLGITGVAVDLTFATGGFLHLTYRVEGGGDVTWPAPVAPARTNELWRRTCFELFVRADEGGGYAEFNFSPSGQWAAYAFDGYRAGMRDLSLPVPPAVGRDGDTVRVTLAGAPAGAMALTAVIEEAGGRRSFWSLAHPAGAPDFHHADCFVARLAAPGAA